VLGCFQGEEGLTRLRREVTNPPPSSPEVKECVELLSLRPLHTFVAWTGTNLRVAPKKSCSEDGNSSGCPRVQWETPESRISTRITLVDLQLDAQNSC